MLIEEAVDETEEPDLPHWLSDQPAQTEASTEVVDEADEPDMPDWLADLPDAQEVEELPSSLSDENDDEPASDWLADLRSIAQDEVNESDLPDWLSDQPIEAEAIEDVDKLDITARLAEQPSEIEITTAALDVSDEPDMPDWLADLPDAQEIEETHPVLSDDESAPDWLADQHDEAEATADATDEPELPDWLADLPQAQEVEELQSSLSDEDGDDEPAPDWLSDLPGVAPITTASLGDKAIEENNEPDLPDWLSDQPAETEAIAENIDASDEPDIPDWLADQPTQTETAAEAIDASDEPDMPDWLSDLPDVQAIEETHSTFFDNDEAAPDWLADLPDAQEIEEVQTTPSDNDELAPDWLSGLRGVAQITTASLGDQAIEETDESDLPEWLADLHTETEPIAEVIDASDEPPSDLPTPQETETSLSAPSDEDIESESPDWLADRSADIETAAEDMDETDEPDMPDWLSNLPDADKIKPADAEVDLEIPNWFAELADIAEMEPVILEEEDSEQDIGSSAPAVDLSETDDLKKESLEGTELEMPDWLSDLPTSPEIEQADIATPPHHSGTLELPDWLSESFEPQEPTPASLEPEPPAHEQQSTENTGEEVPLWLAVLRETKGQDVNPDELRYDPTTFEEEHPTIPDSAAEIEASESELSQLEIDQLDNNTVPQPDTAPSVEDDEIVMPAWLMDTASETPQSELEEREPEIEAPDDTLDMPHWLLDAEDDAEPGITQPDTQALETFEAQDDLDAPAWLLDTAIEADAPQPATQEIATADAQAIETDKESDDLTTPGWLLDSDTDDEIFNETADTPDAPAWLLDTTTDDEPDSPLFKTEEIAPVDKTDDKLDTPHWLLDDETESDAVQPEAEVTAASVSHLQSDKIDTTEESLAAEDEGKDLVMPAWLFKGSLEELETPEWLQDAPGEEEEAGSTVSNWMTQLQETTEQSASETDTDEDNYVIASQRLGLAIPSQEPPPPPRQEEKSEEPPAETEEVQSSLTGAPTQSAANLSGWLEALRTDEKIDTDDDRDNETLERTGMLASLGSFMPAEKLFTPTAEGPLDDMQLAAQKFHEIATQPPQPATLPVPLSRSEKVAGRALRAVLQLLFVALIALPLLPGTGKFINGQRVPWTEPTDNFSTVLDEQRRQLISDQIGIIDVQQPDSVALVSFDYSPATQGEMQPLAEAIMGRLVGQGMRIIAVSLEPEGPAIAQTTIEQALSDRDQADMYGQSVINLGYLPGQAAAVRALVDGRSLTTLVDFSSGEPFKSTEQTTWDDIETLEQVDLVVTLADNPTTARWWIEQLEFETQNQDRLLLAATSAVAEPFLLPYRQSEQLNGLISGIYGAAAIEAVRNNFGSARAMLDSQSIAHLIIIILIAVGTMVGWMPQDAPAPSRKEKETSERSSNSEPPQAQSEQPPIDDDEDDYEDDDEDDEPEIQE